MSLGRPLNCYRVGTCPGVGIVLGSGLALGTFPVVVVFSAVGTCSGSTFILM